MNPTEKQEMQMEVTEQIDKSAIAELPPDVENPQVEDSEENLKEEPQGFSGDNDADPEREAIRDARREERRLKKNIHREKAKESNHLISALRKQNEMLAERLARVEQKTTGAEFARIDKQLDDVMTQVEYSKMKMKEAADRSDGSSLAEATDLYYESRRKLESLQVLKENASRQVSQQKNQLSVPNPSVQKHAADWLEENPWYDPAGQDEASEIAQIIDKRLTKDGWDPSTQDYWEELDDRLQKYLPQNAKASYNVSNNPRKPKSFMTSSGREAQVTSKPNQFVLSAERVSALKEAGVWDNADLRAKMVRKYAEYDRQSKQKGAK
jgi:hypothetical protein